MSNSKKLKAHQKDQRLDHKRLRAATKQVIQGGKLRNIFWSKWSVRTPQAPYIEWDEVDEDD